MTIFLPTLLYCCYTTLWNAEVVNWPITLYNNEVILIRGVFLFNCIVYSFLQLQIVAATRNPVRSWGRKFRGCETAKASKRSHDVWKSVVTKSFTRPEILKLFFLNFKLVLKCRQIGIAVLQRTLKSPKNCWKRLSQFCCFMHSGVVARREKWEGNLPPPQKTLGCRKCMFLSKKARRKIQTF